MYFGLRISVFRQVGNMGLLMPVYIACVWWYVPRVFRDHHYSWNSYLVLATRQRRQLSFVWRYDIIILDADISAPEEISRRIANNIS